MLDLTFDAEQDALRTMLRDLLAAHAPLSRVREMEDDPVGYDPALWQQLVDLDLVGLLLPEAHGGSGMSLLEGVVLFEELGRALTPSPLFVSTVLVGGALVRGGSAEQQAALVPGIAAGSTIASVAWFEPGNSAAPRGVQLRATSDGEGFVLSGTKWHVPFASSAQTLLVLARTGDDAADVDLFLVDATAQGVSMRQMTTLASDTQHEVVFDGVRVDASARVGAQGTGWATWQAVMLEASVLLGAQAVGGARAAFEMTNQYAKDRVQFDKPLGAFQAISHYLADAVTALDGAEVLVHEAAWAASTGRSIERLAPMAVRLRHVPRPHRHGATGVRWRGLHGRVRHPALLQAGQAAPDLLVGRTHLRGAHRRHHPRHRRTSRPHGLTAAATRPARD
jgi:alkylation response protein AidB-like acyl-CoA dehydrogenase